MIDVVSMYFLVVALILLVMLVFLYKLTMSISRLDGRLEQLARHLRDLNLYDFHSAEPGMLGVETEFETDSGKETQDPMMVSDGTREVTPPNAGDVTPTEQYIPANE